MEEVFKIILHIKIYQNSKGLVAVFKLASLDKQTQ